MRWRRPMGGISGRCPQAVPAVLDAVADAALDNDAVASRSTTTTRCRTPTTTRSRCHSPSPCPSPCCFRSPTTTMRSTLSRLTTTTCCRTPSRRACAARRRHRARSRAAAARQRHRPLRGWRRRARHAAPALRWRSGNRLPFRHRARLFVARCGGGVRRDVYGAACGAWRRRRAGAFECCGSRCASAPCGGAVVATVAVRVDMVMAGDVSCERRARTSRRASRGGDDVCGPALAAAVERGLVGSLA